MKIYKVIGEVMCAEWADEDHSIYFSTFEKAKDFAETTLDNHLRLLTQAALENGDRYVDGYYFIIDISIRQEWIDEKEEDEAYITETNIFHYSCYEHTPEENSEFIKKYSARKRSRRIKNGVSSKHQQ